jgi:hypothetical protein
MVTLFPQKMKDLFFLRAAYFRLTQVNFYGSLTKNSVDPS